MARSLCNDSFSVQGTLTLPSAFLFPFSPPSLSYSFSRLFSMYDIQPSSSHFYFLSPRSFLYIFIPPAVLQGVMASARQAMKIGTDQEIDRWNHKRKKRRKLLSSKKRLSGHFLVTVVGVSDPFVFCVFYYVHPVLFFFHFLMALRFPLFFFLRSRCPSQFSLVFTCFSSWSSKLSRRRV